MSFNDGFSVYSIPYVTGSDGQLLTWSSTENRWIPGSGLGSIVSAVSTSNGIIGDGTNGNSVRLSSSITVQNLYVEQTASIAHLDYIYQQSLIVGDKYITLMSGANNHSLMDGSGILWGSGSTDLTTGDQGSAAYILYRNNTRDQLEIFPGLYVSGSLTASSGISGSLIGTASYSLDSDKLDGFHASAFAQLNATASFTQVTASQGFSGSLTGSFSGSSPSVIDVSSSLPALTITQRGTGHAILIEDSKPDASPFIINGDGRVGIGLTDPISNLQIVGSLIQGLSAETFIGVGAHAEGYSTYASGNYSHAEGRDTDAFGYASHAEGRDTDAFGSGSHAEGWTTRANGDYSHAEGDVTVASGSYSHAEGRYTVTTGSWSHAEGIGTIAYESGSHAEGYACKAYGAYSHAEGDATNARGISSHAEGYVTYADGLRSHAEGHNSSTSGSYSHAEGWLTQTTGTYSHAEGQNARAIGLASHAEGLTTYATGNYSHAEGYGTHASGSYSHAEGGFSYAIGNYSHAEGDGTRAYGTASHAEGRVTSASYAYSHAEGLRTLASASFSHTEGAFTLTLGSGSSAKGLLTTASADFQSVAGICNSVDNNALYIIGNGLVTYETSPNGFEIQKLQILSTGNIFEAYRERVSISGSLGITGGLRLPIVTTSSLYYTYSTGSDHTVIFTGTNATGVLPSAVEAPGFVFIAKNLSDNTDLFITASSGKIDGETSGYTFKTKYTSYTFQSDGTDWYKL